MTVSALSAGSFAVLGWGVIGLVVLVSLYELVTLFREAGRRSTR